MKEIFDIVDRFIYYILLVLGFIWTLLVIIYKAKVSELSKSIIAEAAARKEAIETEIKERKEAIETEIKERKEAVQEILQAIKISESNYVRSNEILLHTFKEGIKEEREFRTDVMIKQGEYIEKIFEKLEVLSTGVGQVSTQLEESVKSQERICEIRHGKA
jgi:hypothetical protein